jgi:hypothetical protein
MRQPFGMDACAWDDAVSGWPERPAQAAPPALRARRGGLQAPKNEQSLPDAHR